MATSRQVTCIVQNSWKERHEKITHVGGSFGKEAEADAIRQIENGTFTYHVKVGSNDVQVIVIKHSSGKKYLRTDPDKTKEDNLLSLPTCP